MTVPLRDLESIPLWLNWWLVEYSHNIKEIPGTENSGRILSYHSHTTLKATNDEVPWCSAAMCCCFDEIGIGGTGSALARSWLNFGTKLKDFRLGAIAVFERGEPDSLSGHVACALSEDGGLITVIGGNQSNAISIAKYPKARLISYQWPPEIDIERYIHG